MQNEQVLLSPGQLLMFVNFSNALVIKQRLLKKHAAVQHKFMSAVEEFVPKTTLFQTVSNLIITCCANKVEPLMDKPLIKSAVIFIIKLLLLFVALLATEVVMTAILCNVGDTYLQWLVRGLVCDQYLQRFQSLPLFYQQGRTPTSKHSENHLSNQSNLEVAINCITHKQYEYVLKVGRYPVTD